MAKTITLEKSSEEELAKAAQKNADLLAQLVEATAGDKRRMRTKAATTLELISAAKPDILQEFAEDICDATMRPEAKTRCAAFGALSNLTALVPEKLDAALEGAEASLYDEVSGPVRLASFVFLARYGATSEERSVKVWPLIDEAIQCYHGDPEFSDMLAATLRFAQGLLAAEVKKGLADRMSFDAANGSGQLKRLANEIVDAAQ